VQVSGRSLNITNSLPCLPQEAALAGQLGLRDELRTLHDSKAMDIQLTQLAAKG
jgi:hypothetical protein